MRPFSTLAVVLATALCTLPALAQTRQPSDLPAAAVDAAVAHVRVRAAGLGLTLDDVSALRVSDGHVSTASGVTYVYLRQQLDGLDVEGTQLTVAVAPDGRVLHAAGSLAGALQASAEPAAGGSRAAGLGADGALRAAAGHVGIALGAVVAEGAVAVGGMPAAQFRADGLSSPATAREVYHRSEAGVLRRAWEVTLDDRRSEHWWQLTVDAATARELSRYDLTTHEAPGLPTAPRADAATTTILALPAQPSPFAGLIASYKVFAAPFESPIHTATPPPADGRTTLADPSNATASPYGWHDTNGAAGTEFTTTRGNNTHTYIDRNDDEAPDTAYPAPDGGAALAFSFPINFAQTPNLYTQASAVNLFYWSNVIHDVLYGYGFTEAAGNFQTNNYSRGGLGSDAVDSEVQSGADICNEVNPCHNNANFSTPVDGQRPRMQMYDGTSVTPAVDGSLDNGVITHEYGHGVSNRLVGGPANVTCLRNTEQMGEGWSDFYGLMLTMRPGDTRATRRPIGNYLFGQTLAGAGIRPAPYSTSFAINSYTYQASRTAAVPHGVGFVWATALWEMTWDLIDAYGFNADLYNATGGAGNQIALRLVTEGLKGTACNPGFVDGRNAILAADAALYPDAANPGRGLHYSLLWQAFARRGLGFSASQGSTTSNADNTEAFDAPLPVAQAAITPSSVSALLAPNGTGTAAITLANTAAAGSQALAYTAQIQPTGASAAEAPPVSDGLAAAPTARDARGRDADADAGTGSAPGFAAGGPDAFGYTWKDSAEPGGPAVSFQSIATTGTAVTWTASSTYAAGDEGYADVALPFSVPFYGAAYTSVRVSTNGFVSFSTFSGSTFTTQALPSTATPNAVVAPFWNDLDLSAAGGGTVHHGALSGGRYAVQFTNAKRYNQAASSLTFQIIFSPSGTIEFQYATMTGTLNAATVGIENSTGTVGLQVARNATYVESNKAVRFTSTLGWLAVSPASGSIAPGAQGTVTLSLNAAGLTEGTYTAQVRVGTNDPARASVVVPVTLTVGGAGVVAGGAGWRLLAAPATGLTVDDLAVMNLVQGVPGYYPPPQAQPNLLTGYDGTTFSSGGTGTALPPGRGFFWYFYNQALTPGGPSNSYPLPTTLATTRTPVTTDLGVALHGNGTRQNMLGNPFGVSLNLAGMGSWPGASALSSTVAQTYDAGIGNYESSLTQPVIAPWQGFFVQATAAAGTLTIPASARTTGGVLQRTGDAPEALVAFELAAADGPLRDRAAVLAFGEAYTEGPDLGDADKLTPTAAAHVLLAIGEGEALRAVESRPLEPLRVPLAVASVGAGTDLVLSWPRMEGLPADWHLVLTDLVTGATVDLAEADHYAFSVEPSAARTAMAPVGTRASGLPARFMVTAGPGSVVAANTDAPLVLALDAPRPNPARAGAVVGYALPAAGPVRLALFDLLGREVAVLATGDAPSGRHTAALDAARLAPGVYVLRLNADGQSLTQRVVVVR